MTVENLEKLAAIISGEKEALLLQWRAQVRQLPSAKHLDLPTLNDHVPDLIDELVLAFRTRSDQTIPETVLAGTPPNHGMQRFDDGFDIVEVVAEYNILRGCIHDFAEQHGLCLQGKAFHTLNRLLDESIGLAVQTFATRQALAMQRRREEYLAFVAHDLRTPLNAISLAARVLERVATGHRVNVDTAATQKTLHRNVRRLEALVETVLKESDHLRTESGVKLERREFDLWPLVEDLVDDLYPIAGTGSTQLINSIPAELTAYADASLLGRVFQNLIANALAYTPRGEVVIGAIENAEGVLECWVKDNGAGIPKDRLAVIFDKMEGDEEVEQSIGLGLAIVKTFVEAHGGAVTVESEEGTGSTFRFTIPRQGSVE